MKPSLGYVEDSLIADSSDYKLRMTGPWMLLYGGTSFVASVDLRAIEANAGVKIGWRTAAVRSDVPDAWEALGTQRTTNGSHPESFDTSAKTGQLFVQGAVFTALTTGAVSKNVYGRFWSSVKGAGWVVARQRILLRPSSSALVIPIGKPFNCTGVTGLMFGFVFNGISGTIDNPACVWRSFATGDPQQPGTWSSSLATLTDVTADSVVNSGNCPIVTADKLMGQAGFKYLTAGVDPNGTVDVIVAAKQ